MSDWFILRGTNGQDYPIRTSACIGRDRSCQIRLHETTVSRVHATVWVQQGALYVRDENSSNGTLVNGTRIATGQPTSLQPGDQLRVGNTSLAVTSVREVTPPAPQPFARAPLPRHRSTISPMILALFGVASVFACAFILIAAAILASNQSALVAGLAKPTVVIQSPTDGSQFREGEQIAIQSVASDTSGVTRVDLFVDGAVAGTTVAPTSQGSPLFTVMQTWKATVGGHTIGVRASNAAGTVSDLATIAITVVASTAPVPPTTLPSAIVTPAPATSTQKPQPRQIAMPYFELGKTLTDQRRYDESIAAFTSAIQTDSQFADAYAWRGRAYYRSAFESLPSQQGALYDLAWNDANKAIAIDPQIAMAYNVRAVVLDDRDDKVDEAIAEYNRAIALDPTFSLAYCNRGIAYVRKGNLDQAFVDFNKALELDPKDAFSYNSRGLAYHHKGNLDQAISDFTKAIELDPIYAYAYDNRGYVYFNMGNLDRAILDYDKAIELNPKFVVAYYDRGRAYYKKGNLDQAIADFSKAIELDPKYAYAYDYRGYVYFQMGNLDRAIADYDKAIELNPKLAVAYDDRGYAYIDKGNLDQAIADFSKAIELDPKYASAYSGRCWAYSDKGNPDQGIADCNKAIELDPKYAAAYVNRGNAYAQKGNLDQALADYAKAIELDPTDAIAYNNRCNVFVGQKKYDLAIADCNKAIQLDPTYARAYKNRGLAYRYKGLKSQAIGDFQTYLRLAPNASDRAQVEQWIRELGG